MGNVKPSGFLGQPLDIPFFYFLRKSIFCLQFLPFQALALKLHREVKGYIASLKSKIFNSITATVSVCIHFDWCNNTIKSLLTVLQCCTERIREREREIGRDREIVICFLRDNSISQDSFFSPFHH